MNPKSLIFSSNTQFQPYRDRVARTKNRSLSCILNEKNKYFVVKYTQDTETW